MLVSRLSNRQAWTMQILLTIVVGAFLLIVVPALVSDFRQNVLGKLFTFAIIAIGLDLLWGYLESPDETAGCTPLTGCWPTAETR